MYNNVSINEVHRSIVLFRYTSYFYMVQVIKSTFISKFFDMNHTNVHMSSILNKNICSHVLDLGTEISFSHFASLDVQYLRFAVNRNLPEKLSEQLLLLPAYCRSQTCHILWTGFFCDQAQFWKDLIKLSCENFLNLRSDSPKQFECPYFNEFRHLVNTDYLMYEYFSTKHEINGLIILWPWKLFRGMASGRAKIHWYLTFQLWRMQSIEMHLLWISQYYTASY